MRHLKAILLYGMIIFIAGCQVMGSSLDVVKRSDGNEVQTCTSGLGSYSLAYSTINVTVFQNYKSADNTPYGHAYLHVNGPEQHPDRDKKFCLDFLESAFADDVVQVAWSGKGNATGTDTRTGAASGNGLLALVVSKNIDRTGDIIRKLIRALFTAISGNPANKFGRSLLPKNLDQREMTQQDFRAFDLNSMAKLNNDITKYGFCITLGKYTHDANKLSANDYCNNPGRSLAAKFKSAHAKIIGNQDYLKAKIPKGIYYRPRQNYSMYYYVQDDPGYSTTWQLRKIETVSLENISPIIGLGITRAAFAEHKVVLAFDNGNLTDYCLAKGSEVEGAIEIPLDIIYGIVSLPAATISAEINRAKNKIGLFDAQDNLIKAQNTYIDFLVNGGGSASKGSAVALAKNTNNFEENVKAANIISFISKAGDDNVESICDKLKTAG